MCFKAPRSPDPGLRMPYERYVLLQERGTLGGTRIDEMYMDMPCMRDLVVVHSHAHTAIGANNISHNIT